jgi:hypothetical protein
MKSKMHEHQKNNSIMVSKNRIIYLVVACIASMSMSGQKLKEAKAEQQYDKFAYVDAIKTYERIFAKGYKPI